MKHLFVECRHERPVVAKPMQGTWRYFNWRCGERYRYNFGNAWGTPKLDIDKSCFDFIETSYKKRILSNQALMHVHWNIY